MPPNYPKNATQNIGQLEGNRNIFLQTNARTNENAAETLMRQSPLDFLGGKKAPSCQNSSPSFAWMATNRPAILRCGLGHNLQTTNGGAKLMRRHVGKIKREGLTPDLLQRVRYSI
jgi:hypothetical protein